MRLWLITPLLWHSQGKARVLSRSFLEDLICSPPGGKDSPIPPHLPLHVPGALLRPAFASGSTEQHEHQYKETPQSKTHQHEAWEEVSK